jgi:hypothetical protein
MKHITLTTLLGLLLIMKTQLLAFSTSGNLANNVQGSCIANYPYYQNFDSGLALNWTSFDDPANTHNDSFEIQNSTYLSRTDDLKQYTLKRPFVNFGPEYQLSYIETPCFNLTGMSDPFISFDIITDGGNGFDMWVEYSTDGGVNYQTLGSTGEPYNWYQNSSIGHENKWEHNGFPYSYIYHGNSLRKVLHTLDFINGQAVTFRIYYNSVNNNSGTDFEVGIDNFSIFDRDAVSFEATIDNSCQYYTYLTSSEANSNLWSFTNFAGAIHDYGFSCSFDYHNFFWLTNDAYPGYVYISYLDNIGYTAPVPLASNSFVCSGDSVLLTVESGHEFYQWFKDNQPIGNNSNQIYVHEQASYYAFFNDVGGCAPYNYNVLYLPLIQSSSSTVNTTICNGATYQFGSQTLSSQGTYTRHLQNNAGCDSLITLNLTVNSCGGIVTQLRTEDCNKQNYRISTNNRLVATNIGSGTYQFEFKNLVTNVIITITGTNVVYLNNPGLNLTTPAQYAVRVRYLQSGVWTNYGSLCIIGILDENAPVANTKIRTQDCGKLTYRLNSNNRIIADPIANANLYEFEFSIAGSGNNNIVAVKTQTSNVLFLNNVNPLLTAPAQYDVRVRAKVFNAWGSFANSCLIGLTGVAREELDEQEQIGQEANQSETINFDVLLFPNPSNDNFNLFISSANNENYIMKITDLLGNEIYNKQISSNQSTLFGQEFAKGVYMLKLYNYSGNHRVVKFIKSN